MSNANLKLVQDLYAAFGRGDIPSILEIMSPDVTMGIVGRKEDAPFLGIRNGKDGAASFFEGLVEAHEIHSFEPLRFLTAEDMVFIWGRYEWTMRKSGVSKQTEWLHVITLQEGKVKSWRGHNDTAMLAEAYHGVPVGEHALNQ